MRVFRLAALLLILAVVSLSEPRVLHFVVKQAVEIEAWRCGGAASVGSVEGTIFEPISLVDSVWSFTSRTGAVTRIEVARATATFSWRSLAGGSASRWFQRLGLEGVSGKVELPTEATHAAKLAVGELVDLRVLRTRWLRAPAVVDARGVDFIVQSQEDYVRFQQGHFTLSELEPGVIKLGRVVVHQSWLEKVFPNVRGTTALKESKVLLANLKLEPGVEITNFSAELAELARGSLQLEARVSAFGGSMHIEGGTQRHDHRLDFEAHGSFSQINIAPLATFLALSDAAGGVIKEGNFSFRGSPQNVAKSTTRLLLDATNFQWESRQWDSLVLGAELIERRLQVHEFALHQGHNELRLSGELTLPEAGRKWWQGDFHCSVLAKIENLTELSALMLPEFTYAAGRVNIDGEVRGRGEKFEGKLDVNGRGLQWRNAPIDELHATLRLHDNELNISHFTLFNDVDSVRGSGVVNILGPTQYWGTLRASVEDLAKYSGILRAPIVPESPGGGAVIDWSGEGSAKGHSGKFTARLKKLRSLGASAVMLHPINAELDGNYAAGSLLFSRFALSDDDSAFTANVAIGNNALSIQGMKLQQRNQLTLEGDALLPLDVWSAWPNTSLAKLLNDEVQTRVAINAYGLDLADAGTLSGWIFPIEGLVRGTLTAEGPLSALKTGGKLVLTKGRIPLGPAGLALTGVEAEATCDGATMTFSKLNGMHPSGDFRASGTVDLTNPRDPALKFTAQSARSRMALFKSTDSPAELDPAALALALDLQIDGPASRATIHGSARPLELSIGGESDRRKLGGDPNAVMIFPPDTTPLWRESGAPEPAEVVAWSDVPWSGWNLDVTLQGAAGALSACDVLVGGTAETPELKGTASFAGLAFSAGDVTLSDGTGTIEWRDGETFIDASAAGTLHEIPFTARLFGPKGALIRLVEAEPPLTPALVRSALAGRYRLSWRLDDPAHFTLRVPAALDGGIVVSEWTITDAPSATGAEIQ